MPYKTYGLEVYQSGINFVVNISNLEAQISYNGLSFSIRLPYSKFGNNTKGQCGESPVPAPLSLECKTGCVPLSLRCGFSFLCGQSLWHCLVFDPCEKAGDVALALALPSVSNQWDTQSLEWRSARA